MKLEIIDRDKISIKEHFIENAVTFITKNLIEKKILSVPKIQKLTIAFVSDDTMISLNSRFRQKNSVTDILSFSLGEEDGFGELVICISQVQAQAEEESLTLEEELVYLILHGILHLLGYHHEEGGEPARLMYQIQDDIFEKWQLHHKKSS